MVPWCAAVASLTESLQPTFSSGVLLLMLKARFLAVAVLCCSGLISNTEAQEVRRVAVTTSVGAYLPSGSVSHRGPGEPSPDYIGLDPGLALGAAAELPTRLRSLRLRADLMLAVPSAVTGSTMTNETRPCGPDCSVIGYDRETLGRAATVFLGGSLVLRPVPEHWSVQPALWLGGAWKRRFYDLALEEEHDARYSLAAEGEGPVSHLGIGAEFSALGHRMSLSADLYARIDYGGPRLIQGEDGRADSMLSLGIALP